MAILSTSLFGFRAQSSRRKKNRFSYSLKGVRRTRVCNCVYPYACVQKLEKYNECHVLSLPALSPSARLSYCPQSQTSRQQAHHPPLSAPQKARATDVPVVVPRPLRAYWDLNPGPHACIAGTQGVNPELPPQPLLFLHFKKQPKVPGEPDPCPAPRST